MTPGGLRPTGGFPDLKRFLAHLRGARNCSPHTLRAYEGDLRKFLAFPAGGVTAGTPFSSARA